MRTYYRLLTLNVTEITDFLLHRFKDLRGNLILDTIEETDDASFDGLVLNDFQAAYADIELLSILSILEGRSSDSERSVEAA